VAELCINKNLQLSVLSAWRCARRKPNTRWDVPQVAASGERCLLLLPIFIAMSLSWAITHL
jgi:hypothetical protein